MQTLTKRQKTAIMHQEVLAMWRKHLDEGRLTRTQAVELIARKKDRTTRQIYKIIRKANENTL